MEAAISGLALIGKHMWRGLPVDNTGTNLKPIH
jgi:hypothetical protein